jgi:GDSL-like Lipase/Acylhydrolase family
MTLSTVRWSQIVLLLVCACGRNGDTVPSDAGPEMADAGLRRAGSSTDASTEVPDDDGPNESPPAAGAPSAADAGYRDGGVSEVPEAPLARALNVMAVGNTSSAGSTGSASYRYWLQKKLDGIEVSYDFVGSQNKTTSDGVKGDYKYPDFDPDHESYPSLRVIDVENPARDTRLQIKGWVQRQKPDIVLVLLGMGDVMYVDAPNYQAIFEGLIDIVKNARAANPQVAILLSSVHPIKAKSRPNSMQNLAALIPYQKKVAAMMHAPTAPVHFVDVWTGYDPDNDNLMNSWHPDESGEKIIAERFFEAVQALLADEAFRSRFER